MTYDSTYGELPIPTRAGYTFNGWYTAVSGGSKITNTTKVSITAKQTLFAQWTANDNNADENEEVETITYSVKYDSNGGTGTMKDSAHVYGVASELSINTFEREDYTFIGWNTKEDGTGDFYKDEQEVTDLSDEDEAVVTLYAQWQADELLEEDNNDTSDDKKDESSDTTNNNNNNNSSSNNNKTEEVTNPKTGSSGLILVSIIGFGSLLYLVYYYKRVRVK